MSENPGSYAVMLAKSRMYLLESLQSRGYDVSSLIGFSVTAIHQMQQSGGLDMMVEDPNSGRKVKVRYHDSKALRAGNVLDYVEDYFTYESILAREDGLIIVSKDPPNDSIKKAVRTAWSQSGAYVAVLPLSTLQFSILDHTLVPKHTVLTEEEADEVRKEFGVVSDGQLPSMSRFDPVAQIIGLRPGQICKIDRPSKTAVTSVFYRICSA